MATSLSQENAKLATEYGIPRLQENQQQKGYYQIHFRRCARYLQWLCVLNFLLVILLLYLFFTRPIEHYYATAFDGKITLLSSNSFAQATAITQLNKLPPQPTQNTNQVQGTS